MRRAARFLNHAGLLILLVAGGFMLVEAGLRVYLTYFGSETDRIKYLELVDDIASRDATYVGQPYTNYGLSPGHPLHNSLGYRGPEFPREKPATTYRIVTLGGSTTYGFYIPDTADTWPAQLERVLHEQYGQTQAQVINAGVIEYTTWESLVNLQFRVLDLDPDLIIVYHATNDITFRLVPPDTYSGLNLSRGIWQTTRDDLGWSALYRFFAINTGLIADPTSLRSGFTFDKSVEHCAYNVEFACLGYAVEDLLALNPPVYFERNLRNIAAVALANDIEVLFSSWAYYPAVIDADIENVYTFPWRQNAADEHNTITHQVAREMGVPFYDLMANLDTNPDYWHPDGHHKSVAGAEAQARLYANFIMAQGWLE